MSDQEELVVLGAGLPRTGTASLSEALKILLGGECYHMFTVFSSKPSDPDVAFWNGALATNPSPAEWRDFLGGRGYRSAVDYPPSKFYK